MFDPITLAVGAGILAAGYAAGRLHRRRSKSSAAVCGCGHGREHHEPLPSGAAGACRAQADRDIVNRHGCLAGQEHVPCTCQQYTGPVPALELLAPTILPDAGGSEPYRR